MGNGFMLLIAALYLCAAIGYWIDGNWPWVIVTLCYATANVALVLAASRRGIAEVVKSLL